MCDKARRSNVGLVVQKHKPIVLSPRSAALPLGRGESGRWQARNRLRGPAVDLPRLFLGFNGVLSGDLWGEASSDLSVG